MNDKTKKHVAHPSHPAHTGRPDDGNAFIPDPSEGRTKKHDDLADKLAGEFLQSATSGEEQGEEGHEEEVDEESGGPFVPSTGASEFADGVDASNPADAERAPFPTTQRSS